MLPLFQRSTLSVRAAFLLLNFLRRSPAGSPERFQQLGGRVAIDFVNTLGGRPDHPDDQYLHNCVVMLDLLSAIRDQLASA
jgi:hypothetical protein